MNSKNKKEKNQTKDNKKNEIKDFSKEEIYYVIDHKNKLEVQNSIITNLDDKSGSCSVRKEDSVMDESLNQSCISTNNKSSENSYIDSNIDKLVSLFIEKFFPKCNLNGFNISKKISLDYFKVKGGKIDKEKIEKSINYINSKKQIIMYNDMITINLEFIHNIGYIFFYNVNKNTIRTTKIRNS